MMKIQRSGVLLLLVLLCLSFSSLQAQDVATDLLGRINNLRTSLGLSPYSLNGALTAAANSHAQWMASTGEVTHNQYDGSRPVDRARANGYASAWVAENIYMGSIARPDDAWTFWINSSIHYAGLTSANFQDVGIGTADGIHGHAFVLVFGNPGGGGGGQVVSSAGGGNSQAAAAPQLAILGYDAVGNVRYQLQDGETLGDVLLIFGYTWEELPDLMTLNGFSDADVRNLDVGQEILVPPHSGTWTPSAPEVTAETTEAVAQANTLAPSPTFDVRDLSPTPTVDSSGIIPTPSGSDSFIVASSPTLPIEQIAPPEVFVMASPSPIASTSPMPSATDVMQVSFLPTIAPSSTPLPESPPTPSADSSIPAWLIGAIVVQVGVLAYAGFEFLRRRGKA